MDREEDKKGSQIGSSVFFSTRKHPKPDDGIADVLSHYVIAPAQAPARLYRLREVAGVLLTFAVAVLLLDTEGLLTWARRMSVGQAQGVLLAVLGPLHSAAERVHLTAPRRAGLALTRRVGQALGAAEDPLLAEGWTGGEETALEALSDDEPLAVDEGGGDEAALAADEEAIEPAEPVTIDGRITVLLIGDSLMAGSLSTALKKALERDARVRVVQATQSATGLSQPEAFDWMRVVPPLVARERPTLVVCALGANDAQSLRFGDLLLEFGSPAWHRAYRLRVGRMMRALTASQARLLWLGLPPMRSKKLQARASALNRIYAESARKNERSVYLPIEALLVDEAGGYTAFRAGPDLRPVRLRLDDGVHYSPAGAKVIARRVVHWLYAQLPSRP